MEREFQNRPWLADAVSGRRGRVELRAPMVGDMNRVMRELCDKLGANDFRLTLDLLWDVLLELRQLSPGASDVLEFWATTGCRHAYALEKIADCGIEMPASPATWFMVKSPRCFEVLQHRLLTAKINDCDERGATPLFYAGSASLFAFLLSKGAEPLLLWSARTLPHPQSLRLALERCPGFRLDPRRMLSDPEHAAATREEYVKLLHAHSVEIPRGLIESCREMRTCHALLSFGYLSNVPGRLNLGLIRWHPRTHKFFWSPLLQQRVMLLLLVFKRKAPQLPRDIRIHLLDLIMN